MAFLAPIVAPLLGAGTAATLGGAAATGSGLGTLLGASGATGGALNSMGILGLEQMGQNDSQQPQSQQTPQTTELDLVSKMLNPTGGLSGAGPGPSEILKLFQ